MRPSTPRPSRRLEILRVSAGVIARYDSERADRYRQRPGNPDQIEIRRFGRATAIRFPKVGYFNRVYDLREEDLQRIPEIHSFYAGISDGFELMVDSSFSADRAVPQLENYGLVVKNQYARLWQDLEADPPIARTNGVFVEPFDISSSKAAGQRFFEIYLEGFGVPANRHAEALKNMARLAGLPGLHCFVAHVDGTPAGIGMLYVLGRVGFLCGGTTRASSRRRGCQIALLRARQQLAFELSCRHLVSWAYDEDVSCRNMLRVGLRRIAVDSGYVPTSLKVAGRDDEP